LIKANFSKGSLPDFIIIITKQGTSRKKFFEVRRREPSIKTKDLYPRYSKIWQECREMGI